MKQFYNILKFEMLGYVKNKIFVGLTIGLVILMGLMLFSPRFTSTTKNDNAQTDSSNSKSSKSILLLDSISEDKNLTLSIFQEDMPDKKIELTDKSIDDLKELISKGDYDSAIVIDSPTKYSYIVKKTNIYNNTSADIDQAMLTKYRLDEMNRLGIPLDSAQNILSTKINSEIVQTDKLQEQNFLYAYILMFFLYFAIMLYGQLVATSVVSEKSSRTMEMLITSAKPSNLMFGKIIGACLAGLSQFIIILGSAFVFFNINKEYWVDNQSIDSIFNIPLDLLLYTILFFVLGYLIYAFLYGAVGSLLSKTEEIGTATMPITIIFIITFVIIVMPALQTGDLNSTLMIVCSYIPLTSPMAMFARISMTTVSPIEIILSVVILIGSTIGIGFLAAKIYRVGVLMYGQKPKLSNIIKLIGKQ